MNKIIYYILVINFISFNKIFSYSWELNFDAFNKIFKHSVFVDSLTFGAYGRAINGVPKFYMTYDGGITWSQTLTDEECFLEPEIRGGMLSPWALSKASSNKFFIACEKGYILESTNTGKSWSRIKSNIDTNLLQLDMFNDSIGIAASEFTLFFTEDGCKTFQQININYSQDAVLTIWDIIILDSDKILIGATSSALKKNVLFLTSDRGENWERISVTNMGTCRFTKLGTSKVWMAIPYDEYIGSKADKYDMIVHSSDGGYTWIEQMKNRNYDNSILNSIQFSDELNGIAVGWYGLIYMTFDGGQNWERFYHKEAYWKDNKFDTGLRTSPTHAFIFDNKGLIYKFDKNLSSISNLIDIYINIFPNPTSDFITIQFSNKEFQPFAAEEKVQIFDMLGIEVMSESIHPMTGSHRMNVEKLPAGVYFISVGTHVEKFVKM